MKHIRVMIVCALACSAATMTSAIDEPKPKKDLQEYYRNRQKEVLEELEYAVVETMSENEIFLKVELRMQRDGEETIVLKCQGKFKENGRNLLVASSKCSEHTLAISGVVNKTTDGNFVFAGELIICAPLIFGENRAPGIERHGITSMILEKNMPKTVDELTRRISRGKQTILSRDPAMIEMEEIVLTRQVEILATWE